MRGGRTNPLNHKRINTLILSLLFLSLVLLPLINIPTANATPTWYNTSWLYRKSHVINYASGAGTNFQINVTVNYGSGSDSGNTVYLGSHSQTDFDDIRFTTSDGTTLLSHWTQQYNSGGQAIFWVKVSDSLSTVPATVYIYYGNSGASSGSNGTNTFIVFADKNEYGSWSKSAAVTPSVSGSDLRLDYTANGAGGFWWFYKTPSGTYSYTDGITVQAMFKQGTGSGGMINGLATHVNTGAGTSYSLGPAGTTNTAYYYKTPFSSLGTSAEAFDTSNYFDYKVLAKNAGLKAKVWKNGTSEPSWEITSSDATSSSGDIGFSFFNQNNADFIILRYIWAKKFCATEPSHGAWGSEEVNGRGIRFYNTSDGVLYVNGALKANGTLTVYSNGTVLSLEGLAGTGKQFYRFSYNTTYVTSNPYSLTVDGNYTVWVYFTPPTPYTVARFNYYPSNASVGAVVHFYDLSVSSSSISAWSWDFGDTGSNLTQNPTHTYSSIGNYTVTLTVTSNIGTNSTTENLSVYNLTIPYMTGWTAGNASGYSQGYGVGWNIGNASGYSQGYTVGWNIGNASGYSQGYTVGWNIGNASGYAQGYSAGWTIGNASGYSQGYAVGWIDGNNTGYILGYADGLAAGGGGTVKYWTMASGLMIGFTFMICGLTIVRRRYEYTYPER